MINLYDGVMDTNLVIPRGVDKTEVIFDFYFPDVSEAAREQQSRQHRRASRFRKRMLQSVSPFSAACIARL